MRENKSSKNPRKYSGEYSVENDVQNEQPRLVHEGLLFIGFSDRPSNQSIAQKWQSIDLGDQSIARADQWIARGDQWIASNQLPEVTNGLPPINCLR